MIIVPAQAVHVFELHAQSASCLEQKAMSTYFDTSSRNSGASSASFRFTHYCAATRYDTQLSELLSELEQRVKAGLHGNEHTDDFLV